MSFNSMGKITKGVNNINFTTLYVEKFSRYLRVIIAILNRRKNGLNTTKQFIRQVIENGKPSTIDANVEVTKKHPEAEQLLKISIQSDDNTVKKVSSSSVSKLLDHDKFAKPEQKLGWFTSAWKSIVIFLDLELLKDSVYLNVIFGLSLYNVAESNFKLMTPFFLRSVGMTKGEVAFCLSLTAFTDILSRLILPVIFDKLGFKKRRIFWISSLFVGISRSILAERTKGISLTVMLVIIGLLRGAVILNVNLSVSECCSLKKLPHAYGLFTVSRGIFALTLSPLVGFVRDYTGSYRMCIHASTSLIILAFILWSTEFSWKAIRQRSSSNNDNAHIQKVSSTDKQLA